jgi:hypothetical protein
MKRLILDTNILFKDPSILTRWSSNFKIIIPDIVLEEAGKVSGRLPGTENLLHLVDNATAKGFVKIAKVDRNKYPYNPDNNNNRISHVDFQLAKFAKDYSKDKNETFLVTEDRLLLKYANDIGVKTLNLFALQNELLSFKTVNIDEVEKGKTISQFQFRHLAISFATGVLLTTVSFLIYKNIDTIFSKAPIWGSALSLLTVAFVFYWVRANYRIGYAIAEFSFGLYSSFWALSPYSPDFDLSILTTNLPKIFSLVGGIYVMVRGLTNFGDGIKGTLVENYWRKVFPN